MKIYVQETNLSRQYIGLAYGSVGLLGFIAAQLDSLLLRLLPRCGFHALTGLPCPSCGATRAGIYLSHLKLLDSFLTNPLFFILYLFLFIFGINATIGAIFKKNLAFQFTSVSRKWIYFFITLIILMNWIYLLIRHV